ncbi:divalent-cation tolerance protein CutA [Allopusillimonas ginsengisoli]|uniref:divalent-cation tolerance protein CutA n=1 Tax=Allopusillimonas ginsengisoli TaxID=453575 RepID=UPI0010C20CEB|nr:divalent-cation tolerance protein CutA [Allopusillimonas ginsengisoli]
MSHYHPVGIVPEGVPPKASAGTEPDIVIVLSNAPDALLAKRIAHVLVEEHLAACVNLGGAGLSMYMWQDTLEGAEEIPIVMKTTSERAPALMERLRQLHPYEVPELLILPVVGGSREYVEWVREQVKPQG